MKNNISGIYCIKNKLNNKKYIGSSKSVYYRWKQCHFPDLKSNNHYNRHLQSAWNKYGECNFEFCVIEECRIEDLLKREGYWIEFHKSWERENGYNLTRIVDGHQILTEESRLKLSQSHKQRFENEDYWTTGLNGKILDLFKQGISKNAIAIKLEITRSAVYSCLEHNGLHENTGKGSEIKLTEENKIKISKLRAEGNSWKNIFETTGISKTQAYRAGVAGTDENYCTDKVKRKSYRTVTNEVIEQVKSLREQGMKWEDIEKKVGVSRFALHQNGITEQFKNMHSKKSPMKITKDMEDEIKLLFSQGKNVTEISNITGIAKSTIRLRKSKQTNDS